MSDIMTSQNTDLSFWDTLYSEVSLQVLRIEVALSLSC
jgi:hypothetical protein